MLSNTIIAFIVRNYFGFVGLIKIVIVHESPFSIKICWT